MPRIKLTETERTIDRLNAWILLQMKTQKKSQADIGYLLNLPGKCIGERLRGVTPWKFGEVLEVVNALGGRLEEILWNM